jgi:uncharacterized phage infection (PIP) family protein YhgE
MNLESRYSTTLRYLRYGCISALHQMGTIIKIIIIMIRIISE